MARKQGMQGFRPKLVSLAVASCFAASGVLANPTNPQVVQGVKSITGLNTPVVTVTTTAPAIINWGSFSINAGELTKFLQPSASSAVLNRVVGGNPSAILGALESNGRVFLVNGSGIVFGANAQIDVAGLVATSLNISNADFLANRMKFAEVAGAGSIVNNGNITTPQGGSVYLVGPAVTNNGIITSPKGEVVLAAGNSVELVNPGTPNLRVEIAAADNEARNLGQIVSESGRIGIYAGLINNSGTIRADSVVNEGGKILLQAKKSVTLESSSILNASGAGGGTIEVLANDLVKVDGRLDASAPVKGDGGFIETSAAKVKFTPGTVVTTAAKNGKTGHYVLDPFDILINVEGDITGDDIEAAVLANNFTLTTADGIGNAGVGSITVDDTISLNSNNSLTLVAHSDIFVNQSITNAKTGGINLYAGWDGTSSKTAPVVVAGGGGDIQLQAAISTLGDVKLIAGGHASQAYGGTVSANGLRIDSLGTSANFQLSNSVNTLSGQSRGGFLFTNDKTLTVGTVGGLSGITVTSGGGPSTVQLGFSTVAKADLNINSDIKVAASFGGASIQLNGDAVYGGNVNIKNAVLTASGDGGEGYGGSINVSTGNGGNVTISGSTLTANAPGNPFSGFFTDTQVDISGNNVTITGSTVQALGGSSDSYGGQMGRVDIDADTNLTVSGSTVLGKGGNGTDGASGYVSLDAFGGTLTVSGGSVIESMGGKGSSGSGGWAETYLDSGSPSTINISGSTVKATAGTGPSGGGYSFVGIFDNGGGNINITNSTIRADGAEGGIVVDAYNGGSTKITNSNLTANSNFASGRDGEAILDVYGTNVTITDSSLMANAGTDSGGYGGEASIVSYSGGGGFNVSGSTIAAKGGPGSIKGSAFIEMGDTEGGNTTFNKSTVTASGLSAGILLGSNANLAVTNSTVTATGTKGVDGGPGAVMLAAYGGTLNTSNSAITATGQTQAEMGEVLLLLDEGPSEFSFLPGSAVFAMATGDITLGALTSNDLVLVASQNGKIVDGNAGGNVMAPFGLLQGFGGVGTLADPIETGVTSLAVMAYGGEIGVLNSGNLVLESLTNMGSGPSAVGTTGTMVFASPISVSGNLSLFANNGMVVEQNIFAGGDLLLDSGIGDLGFNGVGVFGNNVTLMGNNILVGFTTSTLPTTVGATNLMKVATLGNLNVLGGANSSANALLHGGVDVDLTVGLASGFVNIAGGSAGASAQIAAGSPDTIKLFFPKLAAGGFFINGVEGAISDGNTGFFVNGLPAVLGENFFVTYGAAELPPAVQQAINQVVASTNQQTELVTNTETTNVGDPKEDKEKKQLPVCSR